MTFEEQRLRTGRASALDVITVAVLVIAIFLFVRPGSELNATVHRRLALRETDRAAQRNWDRLVSVAQPLFSGGGQPDVIEFSDYECPFCRASLPVVDSAVAIGVRVAIVHMPLVIHSHARSAALAAICAGQVGRFKEAHRFLLTTTSWESEAPLVNMPEVIESSASGQLRECIMNHGADTVLARHLALVDSLRIAGTPTFVSRHGVLSDPISAASIVALAGRR